MQRVRTVGARRHRTAASVKGLGNECARQRRPKGERVLVQWRAACRRPMRDRHGDLAWAGRYQGWSGGEGGNDESDAAVERRMVRGEGAVSAGVERIAMVRITSVVGAGMVAAHGAHVRGHACCHGDARHIGRYRQQAPCKHGEPGDRSGLMAGASHACPEQKLAKWCHAEKGRRHSSCCDKSTRPPSSLAFATDGCMCRGIKVVLEWRLPSMSTWRVA